MATTDCLRLNQTLMFEKIRSGLGNIRHTQNLIEVMDDLLYAWHAKESCLIVTNWRYTPNTNTCQSLSPSIPLNFDVNRILGSKQNTFIALAGQRGVAILELPFRMYKDGKYAPGHDKVTCRTTNLDGSLFNNNPNLQVLQLRWHPASPTDSHLLVLLCNNTIRVYDNGNLRSSWRVGPNWLGNPSTLTSCALGETVVDFDIIPAANASSTTTDDSNDNNSSNNTKITLVGSRSANNNITLRDVDKVEWPLIILRENGNVYVLMADLYTPTPRLQGPLTITPSKIDNYGLDSCSILVLPSLPPTVIIAETNGRLHHAIFLESEEAEDSFNKVDESLIMDPCNWTVHVLETVELELGLLKHNNPSYVCPILLKRDFINEWRYFAYHDTGLHVITINFIRELQIFLDSTVNLDVNTVANPARAEYIVCTKIDSDEKVNPVLGFALPQMPASIILLLASGQVISLQLMNTAELLIDDAKSQLNTSKSIDPESKKYLNETLDVCFIDRIKCLLQRDCTQPILALNKNSTPTMQECYELLSQAIDVRRSQYLEKHAVVKTEIAKRVCTIQLYTKQQKQDIIEIEKERQIIRDTAHRLAEKYEDLYEKQEILTKKCQDLMRQANTRLPSINLAEKEFAKQVERLNDTTTKMGNSLQKLKATINQQKYHISKYENSEKKKVFQLPTNQERTIKEILLQLNAEIDGQIKELKYMKKIVFDPNEYHHSH